MVERSTGSRVLLFWSFNDLRSADRSLKFFLKAQFPAAAHSCYQTQSWNSLQMSCSLWLCEPAAFSFTPPDVHLILTPPG